MDTAQALQVKAASALIREGIAALLAVLKRRALEFKHTPTIGRTHGIHAEPTTFGLKLLNWYAEMERNLARFDAAAEDMRVGKLSGAVGTFGHLKPEHEETHLREAGPEAGACGDAGHPARSACGVHFDAGDYGQHAGQDCGRDSASAAYRSARGAGVFLREAKRLVGDAAQEESDYQRADQRAGAGVARQCAGGVRECAAVARARHFAFFGGAGHFSRFDDSGGLSAGKATDLIDRLLVYPERMKRNLESTGGLIFSGQLLLDLAEAGMLREDAYRLVQSHAMRAWKDDLVFREEVVRDAEITKLLSAEKLEQTFDYTRQLGNVDAIFKRVLE